MAQERMDDWMEYARELARAERELRIERWVFISIECKDEAGNAVRLHFIDIIKLPFQASTTSQISLSSEQSILSNLSFCIATHNM